MMTYAQRRANYHALLTSKGYRRLRAAHLAAHPLCQRCLEQGIVTAAAEVHHISRVEGAGTPEGMRTRAFDPDNLLSLCEECHKAVHAAAAGRSKERFKEQKRREITAACQKFFGDTPGEVFKPGEGVTTAAPKPRKNAR